MILGYFGGSDSGSSREHSRALPGPGLPQWRCLKQLTERRHPEFISIVGLVVYKYTYDVLYIYIYTCTHSTRTTTVKSWLTGLILGVPCQYFA